jgi:hypothetical protein
MPRTKTPQPRKLHRTLHLQHHHHTGKLLHHRHTSYRGLALLLILAGAFMVGLNIMAHVTADQMIQVYGRIPATMPTEPPVITSPANGSSVTKSSVIVEGTCPDITPRVVISLTVDGVFVGSSNCDDANHFSVPIVVDPGLHTLVAQTYTITTDRGPDSAPVTFAYTVPGPVTSSESIAAAQQAEEHKTTPLVVTIDEPFIVFGPTVDAVWTGSITGGRTPYHVYIDWGDGTASSYTIQQSGNQRFAHRYHAMSPHRILMRVTDPDGRGVTQIYAAVTPYIPPVSGSLGATPNRPFSGSTPLGLYGIYLLLIAAFGYLWVKEHPKQYAYAKVTVNSASARRAAIVAAHRRKAKGRR